MDNRNIIEILERKGVRVTSIRILVMEALTAASRPMSLSDLETVLDTVDKSSIFRSLEAFEKHHAVEDFSFAILLYLKENVYIPTHNHPFRRNPFS